MSTVPVVVDVDRPAGVEARQDEGVAVDFPKRSGGRKVEDSGVDPESASTEVAAKAKRRTFTAEYKLRIVQEADTVKGHGGVGALLRREGLYSSLLTEWREQRRRGELKGLAPRKRGPKAAPVNPLQAQVDQLAREKRALERKLAKVYAMLEVQKKASEMLGIPLKTLELDEDD